MPAKGHYPSEIENLLYYLSLRFGHLTTLLSQETKALNGMSNGLELRGGTNQEVIYILYESSPLKCCCWPVTKSCPTLCDPMDCSMPGSSVLPCLPEFAQIHIHLVSDAIYPSYPLPSSSPFAFSLSQHQSFPMSWLFASDGQSIGVSSTIRPMNIQGWFPLGLTGLISLLSRDSQESSPDHNSKTSILWPSAFHIRLWEKP